MHTCPELERILVRDGIILRKYWFSVSDEEQERRFQKRSSDPTRRWKLSPMDLKSRDMWVAYSRAKDEMFRYTHTPEAPWYRSSPMTSGGPVSTAFRTSSTRLSTRT